MEKIIFVLFVCSLLLFLYEHKKNKRLLSEIEQERKQHEQQIMEISKKEEQNRRVLIQLTKVAERVAQGDLDVEVECCGEGEIKLLAESMKKTTAELKKRIAYIKSLAYLDSLTELSNKMAYAKRVEVLESELAQNPKLQFGIAMLDINNLKMVNDSMGHEMGDLLIQKATDMMKAVFKDCIMYRVGGDEFVILFFPPLLEQIESLVTKFEEYQTEYNQTHHEFPCGVWVAVGYSVYDHIKDSKYMDVFKRADELMYWNKNQKKAFVHANQQKQES